MAKKRCRFGRVKSGARKGLCRKRKLSGAAARGGRRRAPKRRRGAFARGRTRNVVGRKASGAGRYCMMTRTASGKSSTRCYRTADGAHNAYMRLGNNRRRRFKSIMFYGKKSG